MMFWLPYYLSNNLSISKSVIGDMASLYDIGGILGSCIAGWLTDRLGSRTLVIVPCLISSLPILLSFRIIPDALWGIYFILIPFCGFLVGSSANLISSAVAADLATNEESPISDEALATVTGIIDGTGSVGAGIGQLVIGCLALWGWDMVFAFLIAVGVASIGLLWPLCKKEYRVWRMRNASWEVEMPQKMAWV